MCGRKTLTKDMQAIIEELAIEEWENPDSYFPSYNIAPTQTSPILVQQTTRVIKPMRWGLVPSWAKDPSMGSRLINARAETLSEKPSFRNLIPRNRCVVVTDGYYEWLRKGDGKTPYYIHHAQGKLLPMAGLWDRWKTPEGDHLLTYTVITTEPRDDIAFIHNRMPVILAHEDLDCWLKTSIYSSLEALKLIQTYDGNLEAYPVSNIVNAPRNNLPECVQPLKK